MSELSPGACVCVTPWQGKRLNYTIKLSLAASSLIWIKFESPWFLIVSVAVLILALPMFWVSTWVFDGEKQEILWRQGFLFAWFTRRRVRFSEVKQISLCKSLEVEWLYLELQGKNQFDQLNWFSSPSAANLLVQTFPFLESFVRLSERTSLLTSARQVARALNFEELQGKYDLHIFHRRTSLAHAAAQENMKKAVNEGPGVAALLRHFDRRQAVSCRSVAIDAWNDARLSRLIFPVSCVYVLLFVPLDDVWYWIVWGATALSALPVVWKSTYVFDTRTQEVAWRQGVLFCWFTRKRVPFNKIKELTFYANTINHSIWNHGEGSRTTYHLAMKLEGENKPLILNSFVSGQSAPTEMSLMLFPLFERCLFRPGSPFHERYFYIPGSGSLLFVGRRLAEVLNFQEQRGDNERHIWHRHTRKGKAQAQTQIDNESIEGPENAALFRELEEM